MKRAHACALPSPPETARAHAPPAIRSVRQHTPLIIPQHPMSSAPRDTEYVPTTRDRKHRAKVQIDHVPARMHPALDGPTTATDRAKAAVCAQCVAPSGTTITRKHRKAAAMPNRRPRAPVLSTKYAPLNPKSARPSRFESEGVAHGK